MDSRFRGKDGTAGKTGPMSPNPENEKAVQVRARAFSFSRLYYENSHFDGSYVASVGPSAIPAFAGIQEHRGLWQLSRSKTMWIPACAGMRGTMWIPACAGMTGTT